MCKKLCFKIIVLSLASHTVYGSYYDDGFDDSVIPTTAEIYKDPITKWKDSPVTGSSKIYCQPGDVILLYITQHDVPADFEWFQVETKKNYGAYNTKVPYEDISGQIHYKIEKQPPYINISYTDTTLGHFLTIKQKDKIIRKELYTFKESAGNRLVSYRLHYTVNWTTGLDGMTVDSPVLSNSAGSGQPPPPLSPPPGSGDGNFSTPLICGIVAAILIAILLMLWVAWKCRNTKTEPIYSEVQYAELQLNQSNGPTPQKKHVTYSQVKGVLMPKQTSQDKTNSPTNPSEPPKNVTHSENKNGGSSLSNEILRKSNPCKVQANPGNHCSRRLPSLPNS